MKFKLGDMVKVKTGDSTSSGLLNGQIGKIIKINYELPNAHGNIGYVHLDIEIPLGNRGGGIWMDEIDLVTPGIFDLSHIKKFGIVNWIDKYYK